MSLEVHYYAGSSASNPVSCFNVTCLTGESFFMMWPRATAWPYHGDRSRGWSRRQHHDDFDGGVGLEARPEGREGVRVDRKRTRSVVASDPSGTSSTTPHTINPLLCQPSRCHTSARRPSGRHPRRRAAAGRRERPQELFIRRSSEGRNTRGPRRLYKYRTPRRGGSMEYGCVRSQDELYLLAACPVERRARPRITAAQQQQQQPAGRRRRTAAQHDQRSSHDSGTTASRVSTSEHILLQRALTPPFGIFFTVTVTRAGLGRELTKHHRRADLRVLVMARNRRP